MQSLTGRVAVITGGASGIGYATAEALAREGMKLVLADIDGSGLAMALSALRRSGTEAIAKVTDVSDLDSVQSLADEAVAAFGSVHVIFNNAGVWTLGYQWETTEADWKWVIGVNLWGVVHGIQAFVPLLLRNPDGGHVVNTASLGGLIAGPMAGPYAASKSAVIAISKSLRGELAMKQAKVGVTVVCPGKVDTPILQRVNQRPGAGVGPILPPEVEAAATLMTSERGIPAGEAASLITEAIKMDQFWVFPGAPDLASRLEEEGAELMAGLTGAPTQGAPGPPARLR